MMIPLAVLENDSAVLGLLAVTLGAIFYTSSSSHPFWQKFYKYVPSLLLCYFIPGIYNSVGLIDGQQSQLYPVISRYLLPASLVLLTISIDYPGLKKLGPKALIMFLAGTAGVMIGGPVALALFQSMSPDSFAETGANSVWRGMTTVAGSWIGGSANQTAMKEVFTVGDEIFSAMIAMDVICANIWMAFLLYGASVSNKVDRWLKADNSAIEHLKERLHKLKNENARIPHTADVIVILAVGLGVTGLAHIFADLIAPYIETNYPNLAQFSLTSKFFWIIVIATTVGMLLALTPVRRLESVGASRIGSVLLYFLVAAVGMNMDILAIFDNPLLFAVGLFWIAVHVLVLLIIAKLIKAPLFFVAVGSQANIGGAASAPIVASAFSPALAPVGVLLAVLGYAVGTYGAYITGLVLQWIGG